VARGKTNDSAKARFGVGDEQALVLDVETIPRCLRLKCRKVVFEYERSLILGVANSSRTRISRTEIAIGIVLGLRRGI
jgi:hypothetical protein